MSQERDCPMDVRRPQWKGNFSGIFPEAKFQLYDLLWRKIQIASFPELSWAVDIIAKDHFIPINMTLYYAVVSRQATICTAANQRGNVSFHTSNARRLIPNRGSSGVAMVYELKSSCKFKKKKKGLWLKLKDVIETSTVWLGRWHWSNMRTKTS